MEKQRYVIMLGQVFRFEEKAPFGVSGLSIAGGFEFRPESKELRCHECGTWRRNLTLHVRLAHSKTTSEYKLEHGLRQGTSMKPPRQKRPISEEQHSRLLRQLERARKVGLVRRTPRIAKMAVETANLRSHCPTQLVGQLLELAAHLGKTPANSDASVELRNAVTERFGTWNAGLLAAGLILNSGGRPLEYSKAVLRESLMDFWALNQRLPKRQEFGTGRLASMNTYRRNFGSLLGAYREAGLGLEAAKSSSRMRNTQRVAAPQVDAESLQRKKIENEQIFDGEVTVTR